MPFTSSRFRDSPFADAHAGARTIMVYDAQKRSLAISYALWFLGGWMGLHRFYNGRPGSGFLIIAVHIVGFVLTVVLLGYAVLAVLYLCVLVDAALIPGWVRRYNMRLIEMLERGDGLPGYGR